MTDLRKAAEMALVALDHTARSAVEQYVIEQQVVTFLKQALAQPEQEPVAQCTNSDKWNCKYCRKTETCEALKDSRNFGEPSKPWVSLTDEEIENISNQIERSDFFDCVIPFARAIEAALRSKNT